MEPIHVPGPPKQAFNKNRPISDLIRAQIKHLKHVEASMPAQLRDVVSQHPITTEGEAAKYIASMTNLFQSQATNSAVPIKPAAPVVITKPAAPISTKPALSIAASAPATKKKAATKKAKAPAKPTAAKPKKRKK